MNGNIDWEMEMEAEAAKNARRTQRAAEEIVESMRELEMALAIMGRHEDLERLEEALAIMKDVAGVA